MPTNEPKSPARAGADAGVESAQSGQKSPRGPRSPGPDCWADAIAVISVLCAIAPMARLAPRRRPVTITRTPQVNGLGGASASPVTIHGRAPCRRIRRGRCSSDAEVNAGGRAQGTDRRRGGRPEFEAEQARGLRRHVRSPELRRAAFAGGQFSELATANSLPSPDVVAPIERGRSLLIEAVIAGLVIEASGEFAWTALRRRVVVDVPAAHAELRRGHP